MQDVQSLNPFISEFLSKYPKPSWSKCIESLLLYGIFTIHRDFDKGLSLDQLIKLTNLNSLSTPKSASSLDFHKLKEATTPQFKVPSPKESFSPKNLLSLSTRKPPINQPPLKLNSGSLLGRSSSERKIPKYLQTISSRIKKDVKKDIHEYKQLINQSTRENSPRADTSSRKITWNDQTQKGEGSFPYKDLKSLSKRELIQDSSNEYIERQPSREKLAYKPDPGEYMHILQSHTRSAQSLHKDKEILISECYDSDMSKTHTQTQEKDSINLQRAIRYPRSGSSNSQRTRENRQYVVSTPQSVKLSPQSILKDPGFAAPQAASKWMPISEPRLASIDSLHLYSRSSLIQDVPSSQVPTQISKEDPDNEIMRIAEEFMKNPFTSYLARNEGMFSVPTSPRVLESWINSPSSNLITSIEMLSPSKSLEFGK